MSDFTDDTLLDGRVKLRQPARGFRAAVDPVLLAAFIPARPGEHVLEAGCGSGAAFLCLAARVPGIVITAIEQDAALAALARDNAARNGLAARATVLAGDIADPALATTLGPFDHALANPPFWLGGTPPPEARRAAATHEGAASLDVWVRFMANSVARGGTVSLILPAARFDAGIAALRQAGCGGALLLPIAPHAGKPARRALLRAIKGGRAPAVILPPLVLHAEPQGYSDTAEQVLRAAAPLA